MLVFLVRIGTFQILKMNLISYCESCDEPDTFFCRLEQWLHEQEEGDVKLSKVLSQNHHEHIWDLTI